MLISTFYVNPAINFHYTPKIKTENAWQSYHASRLAVSTECQGKTDTAGTRVPSQACNASNINCVLPTARTFLKFSAAFLFVFFIFVLFFVPATLSACCSPPFTIKRASQADVLTKRQSTCSERATEASRNRRLCGQTQYICSDLNQIWSVTGDCADGTPKHMPGLEKSWSITWQADVRTERQNKPRTEENPSGWRMTLR